MSAPTLPPPPPPPAQSVPPVRRPRVLLAIGVSVLVVTVLTIAVATRNDRSSEAAESPAPSVTPNSMPSALPTLATIPGYPGTWRRYESAEGGFAVIGPIDPVESFRNGVHAVVLDEFSTTGSVYWFDEPGPPRSDVSFLLIQVKQVLKDVDGRVTARSAITIDSHPGVALRVEGHVGGRKFFYIMRLCVIDGRFYEVAASLALPPPSHEELARAELFLDSFTLL